MSRAANKEPPAAGKLGGQAARSSMGPAPKGRKAEAARGEVETTSPRRGRPAAAGEPRGVTLRLRLTEDERARWEAAAGGRGHVSEWVRRVVEAEIGGET